MSKFATLGALALLAVSAAACGRMADLEAPQPRQTERAPRDAGAEALPDPATVNRPSSQMPIDGGPSNPFGGTAAGREPR
jgi:predicted small lipoprotein YifL